MISNKKMLAYCKVEEHQRCISAQCPTTLIMEMDSTGRASSDKCSDALEAYRMHGNDVTDKYSVLPDYAHMFRDQFRINSMKMNDGETGELLWSQDYSQEELWQDELTLNLPKTILTRPIVTREICFSSEQQLSHLKLVQHILLNGTMIEEWKFSFGFLIEGSTNTWQQTIKSSSGIMDVETLSGNLIIETSFYDDNDFITKTKMRVFYI